MAMYKKEHKPVQWRVWKTNDKIPNISWQIEEYFRQPDFTEKVLRELHGLSGLQLPDAFEETNSYLKLCMNLIFPLYLLRKHK